MLSFFFWFEYSLYLKSFFLFSSCDDGGAGFTIVLVNLRGGCGDCGRRDHLYKNIPLFGNIFFLRVFLKS